MPESLIVFLSSLFVIIKSATSATKYAVRLAEDFHMTKYIVGLIVVAFISILPEALIGISSAIKGVPEFGLGTLFGSNVSDLTLVFVVIIFLSGRGFRIENKILKNHLIYPLLLFFPLILGFDGYYSRLDGTALIIGGLIFYFFAFKNGMSNDYREEYKNHYIKNITFLLISMAGLIFGSHYLVNSATELAEMMGISKILIALIIVGVGTTIPEMMFALKAVKKHNSSLAIGDILGTVLADATIVLGVLSLIKPFSFPYTIVYITGFFMVGAGLILFYFMRSGKVLSKKESYYLLIYWLVFVIVESVINS